MLDVPAPPKRTSGIAPNFLWDKTAYSLGRTLGKGKRTAKEHAAFRTAHLEFLVGTTDNGLNALRCFLENWTPDRFDLAPFVSDMLDQNIVFRLDGDSGYIHERGAAKPLVEGRGGDGPPIMCLVTGSIGPRRLLHPSIKGVDSAKQVVQSLVTFNCKSFESYGQTQGANAPTSEAAAFRYGAALNRLLDRGVSKNRQKIGDATVAFWADTSGVGEEAAAAAEQLFGWMSEPTDDASEAKQLADALEAMAAGRPLQDAAPKLASGTRFHVLGLAPNAARLSVRFWLDGDFEIFARRLAAHYRDLSVEPAPWRAKPPSLQRLLLKTVSLQENIPPLLAGETMRAILSGSRYPRTLLSAAIGRLRAGDNPGTGWHAAVIKACINRAAIQKTRIDPATANEKSAEKLKKETLPVALQPDHPSAAYQLGRLFAVMESAQYAALGRVNAPIGDRYFASASSTPARVFAPLLRGMQNHIADARKRNQGGWVAPKAAEIIARLPPDLPKTLSLEDQGRFAVGYYHQRASRPVAATEETSAEGEQNS